MCCTSHFWFYQSILWIMKNVAVSNWIDKSSMIYSSWNRINFVCVCFDFSHNLILKSLFRMTNDVHSLWLLGILYFFRLDSMSWKWHSFFVGIRWNVIGNERDNLWRSARFAAEYTAKPNVYTFLAFLLLLLLLGPIKWRLHTRTYAIQKHRHIQRNISRNWLLWTTLFLLQSSNKTRR